MAMDDFGKEYYRKEETILKDFTNRQNPIIKALTEDGTWKVMSTSEVPLYLPHSKLYKLPNSEEDQNQWSARVAKDSDTWLYTILFTYCAISACDKERRESLFDKINELPTIYEVVTSNGKNQEVATEQDKKRVEDKSTVSGHCKAFSNSEVEQQGMSSSILVKDLKREGKKAITKREPPM